MQGLNLRRPLRSGGVVGAGVCHGCGLREPLRPELAGRHWEFGYSNVSIQPLDRACCGPGFGNLKRMLCGGGVMLAPPLSCVAAIPVGCGTASKRRATSRRARMTDGHHRG